MALEEERIPSEGQDSTTKIYCFFFERYDNLQVRLSYYLTSTTCGVEEITHIRGIKSHY